MSNLNFLLLLFFFRNYYNFLSEVCILASKFVHFKLFFICCFHMRLTLCYVRFQIDVFIPTSGSDVRLVYY